MKTTALRSVLLDPEVNNFPPSKTQSELLKKIKVSGAPHPSYDLVSTFLFVHYVGKLLVNLSP